jgi:hypothetical protein
MKGIIFTEFLDMVETQFGLAVVDEIITNSHTVNNGVYTSVGTYDFNEMVALLVALGEVVSKDIQDLLYTFGLYLFQSLDEAHPEIIRNYKSPMPLIAAIEDHIHVHVKKLYPDADLPSFLILEKFKSKLVLVYSSKRGLYSLAHGLIVSAFKHYGQQVKVSYDLLETDGTKVKFIVEAHV